jgi:hemolysin III
MIETQFIRDEKEHTVAVILDFAEYERLKKQEEEREYFKQLSETGTVSETAAPRKEKQPLEADPNRRRVDLFSAISHLVGVGLSIAGLVILLVMASTQATAWHVVSFSIFGSSLILMFLASTLYHWFPYPSKVKNIFRRIDHSMIYLLIAGTYTPICLVAIRGPWGWSLFGVVWALAIWGIVMKATWIKIPRIVSSMSYILLSWMVLIAFVPLFKAVPLGGILLLLGGGAFYTIGTLFYGLDKKHPSRNWFNFHDLFHLFILGGAVCHFFMMLLYILPIGG